LETERHLRQHTSVHQLANVLGALGVGQRYFKRKAVLIAAQLQQSALGVSEQIARIVTDKQRNVVAE
jgi:hypothetical protein